MRCRHRLSKLLLRHGIRFDDGAAWTQRHRDWLATVTLNWPAAQATLLDARGATDALTHRREQLGREIIAMIPGSPRSVQVGRSRCLRGVDTLTAVGLCAEIGNFERFARTEQLMSYIGLVPCQNTTGQQRRLGSITKTGSGHARRLLVGPHRRDSARDVTCHGWCKAAHKGDQRAASGIKTSLRSRLAGNGRGVAYETVCRNHAVYSLSTHLDGNHQRCRARHRPNLGSLRDVPTGVAHLASILRAR